ncbi:PD-(D/E)XK nuclease family protein [Alkalihalobacillus trypoxylicola]|uniref:PD-(D/E)XK endonuclease-like domain-containing protein n=1 Tax=Alkalihalobacillus trypoxylicola TaxID=519424 RepID=A0A162EDQ5_9BACI|nr:PD-(D/E)XK nuclease family protein [Alkalihalobacillus trypoxylicola]KYG32340.1 hypothetical protein AZF04_06140 [Alkalihalobacillus trypoxylicola]
MTKQIIYGTSFLDVAHVERLNQAVLFQQEQETKVLYILPSKAWLTKASELQNKLTYMNFDELASFIIEKVKHEVISISEHERTLFFQQFVDEQLGQFDNIQIKGQSKGLADTYGQIKRLGMELNHVPPALEALKPLFEQYEESILKEKNIYDPENIILLAVALLKQNPLESLKLIVDGFISFNPLQLQMLEACAEVGLEIDMYIPNDQTFTIVEHMRNELRQIGFIDYYRFSEMEEFLPKMVLAHASTAEEEERAILLNIQKSDKAYDDFSIIWADEYADVTTFIERAKSYDIPLQMADKFKVSSSKLSHFIQLIFFHNQFDSKWKLAPLWEQLLAISFCNPLDYTNEKERFIEGDNDHLIEYKEMYEVIVQYRWPKKATFTDYLIQLKQLLEKLKLKEKWRKRLNSEEDLSILKQIAIEYRCYQVLEEKIDQYLEQLSERGLDSISMNLDLFQEWFQETGKQLEIFLERGQNHGVAVHTWRDIGLIKGKKIYVVGMNEGIFPRGQSLRGYVQERDLVEVASEYRIPNHESQIKTQEAFFQQLLLLADEIVFSYIKGMDEEYPRLPSPLLEGLSMVHIEWSFEERMNNKEVSSESDQLEMIAYHSGQGFKIDNQWMNAEFIHYQQNLKYLEAFEEDIEEKHQLKMQKNHVAITSLEAYARCPFKYVMERELEIREPNKELKQISPIDIGDLIHEIIESIYTELKLVGKEFSSVDEEKKEEIRRKLDEKFEELWKDVEERNQEITSLEIRLVKKLWKKRLMNWWFAERKHFWDNQRLPKMKIKQLEVPISESFTLPSGKKLHLKGKVDRLDEDESGFVIYDYKTGQASIDRQEVQSGLKLQLPLYAYMIQKQLTKRGESSKIGYGASYISLRDPHKRASNGIWHSQFVGSQSPFHVSSRTKNQESDWANDPYLAQYQIPKKLEELWQGTFSQYPVKPLECSNFCPYKAVCRVTEEQKERGKNNEF